MVRVLSLDQRRTACVSTTKRESYSCVQLFYYKADNLNAQVTTEFSHTRSVIPLDLLRTTSHQIADPRLGQRLVVSDETIRSTVVVLALLLLVFALHC